MGLPILLSEKYQKKKQKFVNFLDNQGIETRPIISGNFANQPAAKLYKLCNKNEKFDNAQKVQELGFLIGLHTKKIGIFVKEIFIKVCSPRYCGLLS